MSMDNCVRHFEITPETVFMTDLDGTVLELLHDPKSRRIDKDAWLAFCMFNEKFPNQVIPITGRDYDQVYECFGNKHSPFPVISSNGAQLRMPDGNEITYSFTSAEEDFIGHMRTEMTAFQKKHPWLVTEVKRFEVGFHCSLVQGYNCERDGGLDNVLDKVRVSSESARVLLSDLHDKAEELGLNFVLAGAEQTNRALSHGAIDKLYSLGWFSKFLAQLPNGGSWSHIVYCGDSLQRGENGSSPGNDRQIAKMVREKGGVVIQVTNGSNGRIPCENDKAEPHLAVETPRQLGNLLKRRVQAFLKEQGLNS